MLLLPKYNLSREARGCGLTEWPVICQVTVFSRANTFPTKTHHLQGRFFLVDITTFYSRPTITRMQPVDASGNAQLRLWCRPRMAYAVVIRTWMYSLDSRGWNCSRVWQIPLSHIIVVHAKYVVSFVFLTGVQNCCSGGINSPPKVLYINSLCHCSMKSAYNSLKYASH